ncbi:DNA polymerase [Clostridium intestinale]|uniref:DNA polymerase n=1 Tax=Clostridium intestinale TaxID=36845 RepID=UPI002DD63F3C|nr:DNA polymerase [Clostridium intestinale]WRY50603.1 DNA polymerase [Clostridium intestinale]
MVKYNYIINDEELVRAIEDIRNAKVIGLDIETTGLNPKKYKIRLVQIAPENKNVIIIDWFKISSHGKNIIKTFLEGDVIKVLHNSKFDYKFLITESIDISNNLYDTMLAAQVIDSGIGSTNFKLENVVFHYTGIEMRKEQQKSNWSKEILSKEQLEYSAYDAYILLSLREEINKQLKSDNLTYIASIEFSTVPAVAQIELNGIYVDTIKLREVQSKFLEEKKQLEKEIRLYLPNTDININSPKQLKGALEGINIYVNSTSKEVLIPLSNKYPVIAIILEYKKLDKLLQFIEKILLNVSEDNRLYSNYFQCITKTGRFSCSDFNLQQIPHDYRIRECFSAPNEKVLVIADYSQVELRIAGEIADDYRIIKAYTDGQDLHSLTASLINNKKSSEISKDDRQAAKALNFGLLYGMGSERFKEYAMNNYGVEMSLEEANEFRNKFFTYYSGLKKWHMVNSVKVKGTSESAISEARTLANRRRLWNGKPSFTEFTNFPVQGTGADILKIALSVLPKALKDTSAKLVATVHDEIIIEAEKADAEKVKMILKTVMEKAGSLILKRIPIISEAKIAENWSEK